jgi:two-component system response regulator
MFVFLLEDEPMERDLFLEQLQDAVGPENEVLSAGNAMEAIALFQKLEAAEQTVKLAFIDLNMPGQLKGKDVLKYLCESQLYDHTAKLILSSSTNPLDKDECAAIGATEFLSKALTRMQNMALIMRAVDKYKDGI